jgi:hypothetical protein
MSYEPRSRSRCWEWLREDEDIEHSEESEEEVAANVDVWTRCLTTFESSRCGWSLINLLAVEQWTCGLSELAFDLDRCLRKSKISS